jgi:predicted Zn-dependent protease
VTPRRDRKLLAAALIGLSLWLAAVVVVTLWRYPEFWVEPEAHYVRAQELFEAGRPDEGRREIQAAMRKAPEGAGYRVYSGYRQLDAGDARAAEHSFREALRIDAGSLEARLGLARALADQRRPDAALAELDRLPGEALDDDQLRRRSQLYGTLHAPGPALADLSRLLDHGSPHPDVLKEATVHAVTLQDWPRVVSLTDWMQATPLDPVTRQWMAGVRANAQLALGERAGAYESYRAAGSPDSLERRAGLAWDLRKFDEAAALFGELAAREPGEARFARMQAFSLLAAGRREAAEAALRDLVAAGRAEEHEIVGVAAVVEAEILRKAREPRVQPTADNVR